MDKEDSRLPFERISYFLWELSLRKELFLDFYESYLDYFHRQQEYKLHLCFSYEADTTLFQYTVVEREQNVLDFCIELLEFLGID